VHIQSDRRNHTNKYKLKENNRREWIADVLNRCLSWQDKKKKQKTNQLINNNSVIIEKENI
jgi:hypothetical protein